MYLLFADSFEKQNTLISHYGNGTFVNVVGIDVFGRLYNSSFTQTNIMYVLMYFLNVTWIVVITRQINSVTICYIEIGLTV